MPCLWHVAETGLFVLFPREPQKALLMTVIFIALVIMETCGSCQSLFVLSIYKEFTFLYDFITLKYGSCSILTDIPSLFSPESSIPLWLVGCLLNCMPLLHSHLLLVWCWCCWKVNCCLHRSLQAGYSWAPQGFLACTKLWVLTHTAKITKMNKQLNIWTSLTEIIITAPSLIF